MGDLKEATIAINLSINKSPGTPESLTNWTIANFKENTFDVGQGAMGRMFDHFLISHKDECAGKGITKAFTEKIVVKMFKCFYTCFPHVAHFLEMSLFQALKNPDLPIMITKINPELNMMFKNDEEKS